MRCDCPISGAYTENFDVALDLEKAIEHINLEEKDMVILKTIFIEDGTLEQAAKRISLSRERTRQRLAYKIIMKMLIFLVSDEINNKNRKYGRVGKTWKDTWWGADEYRKTLIRNNT